MRLAWRYKQAKMWQNTANIANVDENYQPEKFGGQQHSHCFSHSHKIRLILTFIPGVKVLRVHIPKREYTEPTGHLWIAVNCSHLVTSQKQATNELTDNIEPPNDGLRASVLYFTQSRPPPRITHYLYDMLAIPERWRFRTNCYLTPSMFCYDLT